MAGLNEAKLIGRLGKDPELRTLQNGSKVCSFSMATSQDWKDKTTGEKKTSTEWHNIVVWNALAEVCAKYLHKGSQVYICGTIRTRMWEKDGIKHYTTEIFCQDMLMLGSKDDGRPAQAPPITAAAPSATPKSDNFSATPPPPTDDLPF